MTPDIPLDELDEILDDFELAPRSVDLHAHDTKLKLKQALLKWRDEHTNAKLDRWKSDILACFVPKCSYCGRKTAKVVGQTTKGKHAQEDNHLPRNWGYYCQRCYDKGMELEREAMYG